VCGAKLRGSGSGRKCEGVTSRGVCKDCQRRAARSKNRANARTSLASADRCGAALKGRSSGKTCTGTVDSDGVCKQCKQREPATETRAKKARLEAATPSTNRCGVTLKGRSSGKTCMGTVGADGVCPKCLQRAGMRARLGAATLECQGRGYCTFTASCGSAVVHARWPTSNLFFREV
jgi:hypothetical protein